MDGGKAISCARVFFCQLNVNAQSASPAVTEPDVQTILAAAGANKVQSVRDELSRGVPVDSRDAEGRTALLVATHANAVQAAQVLIAAGADVNAKDQMQDSPYLYAGAEGRLAILKMTVAAGADLNSVNRYGGTALTPAAHHGHVDVVRYLLSTPIDVNHVNFLGWTALLEAVILGDGGERYQEIVALLVGAKADATIPDKNGTTALEHAVIKGYTEIADLLR